MKISSIIIHSICGWCNVGVGGCTFHWIILEGGHEILKTVWMGRKFPANLKEKSLLRNFCLVNAESILLVDGLEITDLAIPTTKPIASFDRMDLWLHPKVSLLFLSNGNGEGTFCWIFSKVGMMTKFSNSTEGAWKRKLSENLSEKLLPHIIAT